LENKEGREPYNLVITKEWMLMVSRYKAHHNGILCNSLGFIGLLYAKDENQKRILSEDIKPIEILNEVAVPIN